MSSKKDIMHRQFAYIGIGLLLIQAQYVGWGVQSPMPNSFVLSSQTPCQKRPVPFDLLDPIWPKSPPEVDLRCRVRFRDPSMSLCHIIPWPNFGDELGPVVTKRILELHFNCSADDLPVIDLSVFGYGRWFDRNETCLLTVGSLWRMVRTGDHIWGTGVAYGKDPES